MFSNYMTDNVILLQALISNVIWITKNVSNIYEIPVQYCTEYVQ